MKRILIIGAGPTGLGAAQRLTELGHGNFSVFERNPYPGGLCASFVDPEGFTWDLAGHVIHSHYRYFDDLIARVMRGEVIWHERSAWVRTRGRWVAYPFQNHIRELPAPAHRECLEGLELAHCRPRPSGNFREWILATFGEGIARRFMLPYNEKVWAYPLDRMDKNWIAERVSVVKKKEIGGDRSASEKDLKWGPNAKFLFPLRGGTGEIFTRIWRGFKDRVTLGAGLESIDPARRRIRLSDGREDAYDALISTAPLDQMVARLEGTDRAMRSAAEELAHNRVFIVGLGLRGKCPSTKCWMYFPDADSPFFRVTYFSNYSPNNVPDVSRFYSLLCESAASEFKIEQREEITEKTIAGLISSGLLGEADRGRIVSRYLAEIDYAYPIPTLGRDRALHALQPVLEEMGIYSRGRFGAWKYEVGNADHSLVQGKEVVDRILGEGEETVWTL